MWYIYPTEYYLAIKKSEILSFAGEWMELENSMLSEIIQAQKYKHPCFLSRLKKQRQESRRGSIREEEGDQWEWGVGDKRGDHVHV
jgi:hypothetical protein